MNDKSAESRRSSPAGGRDPNRHPDRDAEVETPETSLSLPVAPEDAEDREPGDVPEVSSPQASAPPAGESAGHGPLRERVSREYVRGPKFWFCDQCGITVTVADFMQWRAIETGGRVLCGNCYTGPRRYNYISCDSCGQAISPNELRSGAARVDEMRFWCYSCAKTHCPEDASGKEPASPPGPASAVAQNRREPAVTAPPPPISAAGKSEPAPMDHGVRRIPLPHEPPARRTSRREDSARAADARREAEERERRQSRLIAAAVAFVLFPILLLALYDVLVVQPRETRNNTEKQAAPSAARPVGAPNREARGSFPRAENRPMATGDTKAKEPETPAPGGGGVIESLADRVNASRDTAPDPLARRQLASDIPGERIEGALRAAGNGDVGAVPSLGRLLKDDDPLVRAAAARALGQLRAREALADLHALLADKNPAVKRATMDALEAITGERWELLENLSEDEWREVLLRRRKARVLKGADVEPGNNTQPNTSPNTPANAQPNTSPNTSPKSASSVEPGAKAGRAPPEPLAPKKTPAGK